MGTAFEAYTTEGILRGKLDDHVPLGDALEHNSELSLQGVELERLRGNGREHHPDATVATEDLLVVVAPPGTAAPVHAAWNPVALVVPPYFVEAELPTMPGFDPGRALSRPGGPFVLVGRVRVGLAVSNDAGRDDHALAWVNRYAVEEVGSELDLLVFFPGAAHAPRDAFLPQLPGSTPPAAA
jgi:hypothetical protein